MEIVRAKGVGLSGSPIAASGWMEREMSPGLTTVIIPTYNRAHMLARALDSLKRQGSRPIEVIVVDDGSGDDSEAVVTRWAEDHETEILRVIYIAKDNGGAPSARNLGLTHARGEYIQFLDSDDLLVAGRIETHVRALEEDEDARIVWSALAIYKECDEAVTGRVMDATMGFDRSTSDQVPHNIVRCLFRRSVCVYLGPWTESLKKYQDWEYSVRISQHKWPTLFNSEVSYIAIAHEDGRIQNIHQDLGRNIACLYDAITSASQLTRPDPSPRVREKIGGKALNALYDATRIGDPALIRRSQHEMRKWFALSDPRRIKGEALAIGALLAGPAIAATISRKILARQKRRRSHR